MYNLLPLLKYCLYFTFSAKVFPSPDPVPQEESRNNLKRKNTTRDLRTIFL
jgi:hypothetical protein